MIGLSLLAVAFGLVVFVPYSICLGVGDWLRNMKRRRRAAKILFP